MAVSARGAFAHAPPLHFIVLGLFAHEPADDFAALDAHAPDIALPGRLVQSGISGKLNCRRQLLRYFRRSEYLLVQLFRMARRHHRLETFRNSQRNEWSAPFWRESPNGRTASDRNIYAPR
jgi:hypothetical protein